VAIFPDSDRAAAQHIYFAENLQIADENVLAYLVNLLLG
jgi:hypothetical protein